MACCVHTWGWLHLLLCIVYMLGASLSHRQVKLLAILVPAWLRLLSHACLLSNELQHMCYYMSLGFMIRYHLLCLLLSGGSLQHHHVIRRGDSNTWQPTLSHHPPTACDPPRVIQPFHACSTSPQAAAYLTVSYQMNCLLPPPVTFWAHSKSVLYHSAPSLVGHPGRNSLYFTHLGPGWASIRRAHPLPLMSEADLRTYPVTAGMLSRTTVHKWYHTDGTSLATRVSWKFIFAHLLTL